MRIPPVSNDTSAYSMLDNPFIVPKDERDAISTYTSPKRSPIEVLRKFIHDNNLRDARKRKHIIVNGNHNSRDTSPALSTDEKSVTTSSSDTTNSSASVTNSDHSTSITSATNGSTTKSHKPLFPDDDDHATKPFSPLRVLNAVKAQETARSKTPAFGEPQGALAKHNANETKDDKSQFLFKFIKKAQESGIEVKNEKGELITDVLDPRLRSLRPGLNFLFPTSGDSKEITNNIPEDTKVQHTLPLQPSLLERIQGLTQAPPITVDVKINRPETINKSYPHLHSFTPPSTFHTSAVEVLPSIHNFLQPNFPGSPPPNPPPGLPVHPSLPPKPLTAQPAFYYAAPNMIPTHQNITFAPRTIVSPPPRQDARGPARQQPAAHNGHHHHPPPPHMKRQPPFDSQAWTRDLGELERDVLAKQSHLLKLQRDFDQRRQLWDRSRNTEADNLTRLRTDIESGHKMVQEDRSSLIQDREQLDKATSEAMEQITDANSRVAKQLQSLSEFTGNINHLIDALECSPLTPTSALGTIVRQLTFIIEEQAYQTTPFLAFSLYRIVAPALRFLLFTLRRHYNIDGIEAITPPQRDIDRFAKLVCGLKSQIDDKQLNDAPGLPTEFETDAYHMSTFRGRPKLSRHSSDVSMQSSNSVRSTTSNTARRHKHVNGNSSTTSASGD